MKEVEILIDKRVLLKGALKLCPICGEEKELTENFTFHRTNNQFNRACTQCTNAARREKAKVKRVKGIWSEERKIRQQERRKEKSDGVYVDKRERHAKPYTLKDEAKKKIYGYAKLDKGKGIETDLSVDFVERCLKEPCIYCGYPSKGLDRVDNSLGHIESNCVPCCDLCNFTRMDNYTHEEMKKLGVTIREIRLEREL